LHPQITQISADFKNVIDAPSLTIMGVPGSHSNRTIHLRESAKSADNCFFQDKTFI
jgi:hypothetical protein